LDQPLRDLDDEMVNEGLVIIPEGGGGQTNNRKHSGSIGNLPNYGSEYRQLFFSFINLSLSIAIYSWFVPTSGFCCYQKGGGELGPNAW